MFLSTLVLLLFVGCVFSVSNPLYTLHQHNNVAVSELLSIDLDNGATKVVIPTSPDGLSDSDAFFSSSKGFINKKLNQFYTTTWRRPYPNTILSLDLATKEVTPFYANVSYAVFGFDEDMQSLLGYGTVGNENLASTYYILTIDPTNAHIKSNVSFQIPIELQDYHFYTAVWDFKAKHVITYLTPPYNTKFDSFIGVFDLKGNVVHLTAIPVSTIWARVPYVSLTFIPNFLRGVVYAVNSTRGSNSVIAMDIETGIQWTLKDTDTSNGYLYGQTVVYDACNHRLVGVIFPPQQWNPYLNSTIVMWDLKTERISHGPTLGTSYQNEYGSYAFLNDC